jgi:DNA-binding NtrC family response regulator
MDATMKKVLVVDDDPLIGMSLKEALNKWNFDVTLIQEGDRAIRQIGNHVYNVVLTDIRMPDVTGMEILEKVKKVSPYTGVVMITAYGTIDQAVEAMKKGAFDYITKPFDLDKIRKCLVNYFRKEEVTNRVGRAGNNFKVNQSLSQFIGQNSRIKELFETLKIAYASDAPVFIQSESGTGKELIASIIHHNSRRKGKPYLKLNCAALPENLIESQLFGHERGSFTGAIRTFKGVFEEADGGTLLLDEITEMPTHVQAKLLRVLQEGEFTRVGSNEPLHTDVRIVATSNRDVQTAIDGGSFRQDLFFRLNVIFLHIVPLRERKDDIPLLCGHFLKKYCSKYSKKINGLSQEVLQHFYDYPWPGNVRELENVIQRCVLICKDNEKIDVKHVFNSWLIGRKEIPQEIMTNEDISLEEMEKRLILSTLKRHNYHKTKTAEILGVTIKTLRNKMLLYGLYSD